MDPHEVQDLKRRKGDRLFYNQPQAIHNEVPRSVLLRNEQEKLIDFDTPVQTTQYTNYYEKPRKKDSSGWRICIILAIIFIMAFIVGIVIYLALESSHETIVKTEHSEPIAPAGAFVALEDFPGETRFKYIFEVTTDDAGYVRVPDEGNFPGLNFDRLLNYGVCCYMNGHKYTCSGEMPVPGNVVIDSYLLGEEDNVCAYIWMSKSLTVTCKLTGMMDAP